MPEYSYRAVSRPGKAFTGVASAHSITALENMLSESGSILIETYDQEDKGMGQSDIQLFGPSVKPVELIDFFVTFGVLIRAGVTIIDALNTLAHEIENPYFRKVLKEVVSSIEAGKLFSDSISAYPRAFSPHVTGMVQAGEHGGKLVETFSEIVRYLEWQEKLKSEVRQATAYPITVLVALSIFIAVLFTFVVPKFVKLLTSLHVPLPLPTRIVMYVSEVFVSSWWYLVFAAILIPLSFRYANRRWEKFALVVDSIKLNMPVFGELNLMLAMSKFAFNFSTLFKSGVSVLQNLELCEGLVGNKVVAKAVRQAKREVEGGLALNESLRRHGVFSSKALMMITVGESSGDLGSALENVADFYNSEIPRKVKRVFTIMEPLTMLLLIGIVGFTAVAIILPILSLFTGMRG